MEAAKAQEAAKQDPKTGAAGEDLSMEEILHSIRKIIAEDDTDGKKPNGKKGENSVPGSDVLELTEMLKEDGSVVSLKQAEAPAPAAPTDVLQTIDQALAPAKPAEKPMEKTAEKPPEKPAAPVAAPAAPAPVAAAAPAAPAPAPAAPAVPASPLLSTEAATEATASLTKLKAAANPEPPPVMTTPSPVFASGATVEQMVMDSLKPMLKSWLDANLPAIVQNIVEREVKKLTK
jgi:cell pole-organizing protein PopZ